jgi:2'-5' RNA ligase
MLPEENAGRHAEITMEPMVRAFIAVPLSVEVRQWLGEARSVLEKALPRGTVRWTAIEGIHVTLKFLGEIPVARIDAVRAVMDRAASGRSPFRIVAEGLGCFPNLRRPRVIWAGLRPQPDLAVLQQRIEEGLEAAGLPREGRAFSPHLTLARVRDGATPRALAEIGRAVEGVRLNPSAEMDVAEFRLFRSVLKPSGPEYSVLFKVGLEPH